MAQNKSEISGITRDPLAQAITRDWWTRGQTPSQRASVNDRIDIFPEITDAYSHINSQMSTYFTKLIGKGLLDQKQGIIISPLAIHTVGMTLKQGKGYRAHDTILFKQENIYRKDAKWDIIKPQSGMNSSIPFNCTHLVRCADIINKSTSTGQSLPQSCLLLGFADNCYADQGMVDCLSRKIA